MRAMVLAAGLGTRLRPLTERWPKPAVPFLGPPLFRYALEALKHVGVSGVCINTHHLPEVMSKVARAEAERAGLEFHAVHEPVIQGTGGGIRGLREFLSHSETFIVFNGDILFTANLQPLLEQHHASQAAATMVLLPMPEGETYAAVECDAGFNVRRIAKHGPGGTALSPWHFSGVHIMTPEVFEFMAKDGPEDINREVYVRMIEAGRRIHGAVARDGYWSDLGTPSRYLATVRDVLFGRAEVPAAFADTTALAGMRNYARKGAHVEGAVVGPALVDSAARVELGASVGSAVYVGERARVPSGARLNRAVVFEDTVLNDGEEVVEAIAWGPHRIAAPVEPE